MILELFKENIGHSSLSEINFEKCIDFLRYLSELNSNNDLFHKNREVKFISFIRKFKNIILIK